MGVWLVLANNWAILGSLSNDPGGAVCSVLSGIVMTVAEGDEGLGETFIPGGVPGGSCGFGVADCAGTTMDGASFGAWAIMASVVAEAGCCRVGVGLV